MTDVEQCASNIGQRSKRSFAVLREGVPAVRHLERSKRNLTPDPVDAVETIIYDFIVEQ